MKTGFLNKRILTFVAFILAMVSAVLLFSGVPKRVAKADDLEELPNYDAYCEITDDTITNLGGVVVVFDYNIVDFVFTSTSGISFRVDYMLFMCLIGDGNETIRLEELDVIDKAKFTDNLYSFAVYIPHNITLSGSEINMDEEVFNIVNGEPLLKFYSIPDATPASSANLEKTTSSVSNNNTGLVLISTVVLLVSAIAVVAVIKGFKSRRH